MTGRRLLDVAAIFKASRGVAAKHVALRQHQLDVYNKTSSLTKAIKSQTDRVTLTVKAASGLGERFSGPGPDHSKREPQSRRHPQDASIRGQDVASGANKSSETKNGILQDHFYEASDQNAPTESASDSSPALKQEKAKGYPVPDGSTFSADLSDAAKRDGGSYSELPQTGPVKIPGFDGREATDKGLPLSVSGRTSDPNFAVKKDSTTSSRYRNPQWQGEKQSPSQVMEPPPAAQSEEPSLQADRDRDVFYTPSFSDEQVVSTLPRVELPKNTGDAQHSDEHAPEAQLNQNVFYSTSDKGKKQPVPHAQAVPEQEQLSNEAYTGLFHSPRVARMLGGQPKSGKPSKGLEMPGAQETPVEQTKRPQEVDQISSSVRTSAQETLDGAPSPPSKIVGSRHPEAKGSEDVRNLAADMAKDAVSMSAGPSQIDSVRGISMTFDAG